MAKGAIAFGGFVGLQAELRNAKAFEEVLVDLGVRGQKSRKWVNNLRRTITSASNEFGVGKEAIASYASVIIDQTGNTELAVKTLRDMTAVAYSANVPMDQLAGTVVEMQSKLALAPDQFITAMGVLASQADKGKVPLSQMAQFLPEVLNAAGAFGHTGVPAMREYGAILQMAARGAGSLAEANTAMNRGLEQIVAKRTAIEKSLGISLKVNGQWRGLADMLKLITGRLVDIEKKGGKVNKIGRGGKRSKVDVEKFVLDIFGIRGKKLIMPLMQQARVGFGERVGADETGAGGLTSLDELIAAGGRTTIAQRVSRKRKLSPELEKWNKSLIRLKNQLHQHLLPALKLVGDALPSIGKALTFVMSNWKILLAIWTSSKMKTFFMQLRQGPGGGRGGGFGDGGGMGDGGGGRKPGQGGRVSRVLGRVGGAGAVVGSFAEGVTMGMAATNAAGEVFTEGASAWSQALSDDRKWNQEIGAEIKKKSRHRMQKVGFTTISKRANKWKKTEKGKALTKAGAGATSELLEALASGDTGRMEAAIKKSRGVATGLLEARRGVVGGGRTALERASGRRAFAALSGAQKAAIFADTHDLIQALQATTAELKNLRNLENSIIKAAQKATIAAVTAGRSGGKKKK
jgi:hypothetical protein